jgi:hypothetical protein
MADKARGKALDEAELEGLFAAARGSAPAPSEALMARILADADAAVPAPPPVAAPRARHAPRTRRGWLARALAGIGGWPAAAGLAAAAFTGLGLGIGAPEMLSELSGGVLSATPDGMEDMLPSYALMLAEG